MRYAPLFVSMLLLGCARYEFDITRPQEFAGHVGSRDDYTFERDPLEYRLRAVDNRLVTQIFNPTDDSITLLGAQSSVVDPEGQSHPLRTQSIAPSSFMKLIFPPPRPRLERVGPSIGFGVGTHIGERHRTVFDDEFEPLDEEPCYFIIYDETESLYWDWNGESDIRLLLAYQRGDNRFTHEFVIHRAKVK